MPYKNNPRQTHRPHLSSRTKPSKSQSVRDNREALMLRLQQAEAAKFTPPRRPIPLNAASNRAVRLSRSRYLSLFTACSILSSSLSPLPAYANDQQEGVAVALIDQEKLPKSPKKNPEETSMLIRPVLGGSTKDVVDDIWEDQLRQWEEGEGNRDEWIDKDFELPSNTGGVGFDASDFIGDIDESLDVEYTIGNPERLVMDPEIVSIPYDEIMGKRVSEIKGEIPGGLRPMTITEMIAFAERNPKAAKKLFKNGPVWVLGGLFRREWKPEGAELTAALFSDLNDVERISGEDKRLIKLTFADNRIWIHRLGLPSPEMYDLAYKNDPRFDYLKDFNFAVAREATKKDIRRFHLKQKWWLTPFAPLAIPYGIYLGIKKINFNFGERKKRRRGYVDYEWNKDGEFDMFSCPPDADFICIDPSDYAGLDFSLPIYPDPGETDSGTFGLHPDHYDLGSIRELEEAEAGEIVPNSESEEADGNQGELPDGNSADIENNEEAGEDGVQLTGGDSESGEGGRIGMSDEDEVNSLLQEMEALLSGSGDSGVDTASPGGAPNHPPTSFSRTSSPRMSEPDQGWEHNEKMKRAHYIITPPLPGYYAGTAYDTFDSGSLTWEYDPQFATRATETFSGFYMHDITGSVKANDTINIFLPHGYAPTKQSIPSGMEILEDPNVPGTFYLKNNNDHELYFDLHFGRPVSTPEEEAALNQRIKEGLDMEKLTETGGINFSEATTQFINGLEGMDNAQKALALLDYNFNIVKLRYSTKAAHDPINYIENPEDYFVFLEKSKLADCDVANTDLVLKLRKAGVPARHRVGYLAENSGSKTILSPPMHAWTEFWDGEKWQTIDGTPTVSGQPNEFLEAFLKEREAEKQEKLDLLKEEVNEGENGEDSEEERQAEEMQEIFGDDEDGGLQLDTMFIPNENILFLIKHFRKQLDTDKKFARLPLTKEHVAVIQESLLDPKDLGKWGADGIIGPFTRRAIVRLQKELGFEKRWQDGIFGLGTLRYVIERAGVNLEEAYEYLDSQSEGTEETH